MIRDPSRRLEHALLFTTFCHAAAMVSMAALLLPMMPGGSTTDDAARIALLEAHPLRFRLGWLPWHLTAVSDGVLALAMLRAHWLPRRPVWLVMALTMVAVTLDQGGQMLWLTRGMSLARQAGRTGDLGPYLQFEGWVMPIVAGWAAVAYTLMALAWTWCFRVAGTWSRLLSFLSVPLWGGFALVGVAQLLPAALRPPSAPIAAGNAAGFILMEMWLILVSERVLARARPEAAHGRWAAWRPPGHRIASRALALFANSRWIRSLGELLRAPEFASDITNVIYVNYLVDASRLLPFVPEGLDLQRLGPEGRHALFTFLTYRHGHFGPTVFGVRRLFPSPIQSNWRIYVRDPRTGVEGVYFVTTAITTWLHALGARVMADVAPMHLLKEGDVSRAKDGTVCLALDPGDGTAPDARALLRPTTNRVLAAPWSECFTDYEALLRYDVPQDRALVAQPWRKRTVRQEIHLDIPLESIEPLEGDVESKAARAIVGDARPLCFRAPVVHFRVAPEEADAW